MAVVLHCNKEQLKMTRIYIIFVGNCLESDALCSFLKSEI